MALTLTRRPDEAILIGPDICVRVVRVEGQSVRLTIEAPKALLVLREELATGDELLRRNVRK